MSRRKMLVFGAILLLVLSMLQTAVDYINENRISETSKQAEYSILIEIEDKSLYLLQDGKCIREFPVASGKSGWPSPLGFWRITEKGDWGEGFGGRWLGLDVPWGKYGIHGTTRQESIGSSASHGCIRMFNSDVKELYSMVRVGTPVVIINGCLGPFGNKFSEIVPGDRGADVMAIQIRLKDLGYFDGWISGIYEDDLKLAVHTFQKRNSLEVKNAITKKDWLAMGFRDFE